MYREIIYSIIGHSIVFGGILFPSLLEFKPKEIVTVIPVRTVSSRDIQQLVNKETPAGKPKPKIPQVAIKQDNPLPKKSWRQRQTLKSEKSAETKSEKKVSTKKTSKTPVKGIKVDQDFEYPEYLLAIRDKIERSWKPPTIRTALQTRVFFKIVRDGTVTRVFVEMKTGNMSFDMSALNAVMNSKPFPTLPDEYKGNEIGIHMDFIFDM